MSLNDINHTNPSTKSDEIAWKNYHEKIKQGRPIIFLINK